MYKIILCDDDKMFMDQLKNIIEQDAECPLSTVFGMYSNAEQLLWDYESDVDLIFVDIGMPHMNGKEAARRLRERDRFVMLVFCTACLPTIECFKVQPFRYIPKELPAGAFRQEIRECLIEMKNRHKKHYVVLTRDGAASRVLADRIIYMTLMKRGCEVHIDSGGSPQRFEKMVTRRKMEDIYEEVKELGFISVHKSYVVNMDYIIKVKGNYIILRDGTQLNVTKSRREAFHKCFAEHLGCNYRRERKVKCTDM